MILNENFWETPAQVKIYAVLVIMALLHISCSNEEKKESSDGAPKWDLIEFQSAKESTLNPLVKQIFLSGECERIPSVVMSFETQAECESLRTSYAEQSPAKVFGCQSGELLLSDERLNCKKIWWDQ